MRLLSARSPALGRPPSYSDDDPTRLFPDKSELKDVRLGPPKDLDGYFPFTPPAIEGGVGRPGGQGPHAVLVATGLWPMPEKTPLNPVIHGKIERDGYTVEKVFFASMPGHYVSGNLYRPTAKADGKRPGVLCPHGHWANGRFYEQRGRTPRRTIAAGAEKTMEGGPLPAAGPLRQLARDGLRRLPLRHGRLRRQRRPSPHRDGLHRRRGRAAAAELHGPADVEQHPRARLPACRCRTWTRKRIGVTGASGGGTQTFMLGAHRRPAGGRVPGRHGVHGDAGRLRLRELLVPARRHRQRRDRRRCSPRSRWP